MSTNATGREPGTATASSPATPDPGCEAGACRSKADSRTHLGHAGRVLVSRRWSGKTLTAHRAAFVRAVLLDATSREIEQHVAAVGPYTV